MACPPVVGRHGHRVEAEDERAGELLGAAPAVGRGVALGGLGKRLGGGAWGGQGEGSHGGVGGGRRVERTGRAGARGWGVAARAEREWRAGPAGARGCADGEACDGVGLDDLRRCAEDGTEFAGGADEAGAVGRVESVVGGWDGEGAEDR